MGAAVQSIISTGSDGIIVDIECHLSNNLPNIVIVGSVSKAVDESRERIRGAFATSHIMLPRKRITVNLAPADVPKADSGFDLAIAVAILLADGQVATPIDRQQAFIGELGLDGSTRPVRGVIGKVLAGRGRGINTFYIPYGNIAQAQLVPRVNLVAVKNLGELYGHLAGLHKLPILATGKGRSVSNRRQQAKPKPTTTVKLSEIVGQQQAKRALEIAAAGGHNVLFSGPPGTGKSMLAKALSTILPPLSREEVLEVTQLHSLASHNYDQIMHQRPFRAPHHSASHVAVIGGGFNIRPGEISLSHRGVLFFDELPEFGRSTLEALRQPLEDRVISVARAKDTAEYPANFILVATANPCPCGYYGTSAGTCRCLPGQISRYRQRLSGPILDRIDLHSSVHEIQHTTLLAKNSSTEDDAVVRKRVLLARKLQTDRYDSNHKLNADMTNADIKHYSQLEPDSSALLNTAADKFNISARSYMRTIKVARTIADLEQSTSIKPTHISEALVYRRALKEYSMY